VVIGHHATAMPIAAAIFDHDGLALDTEGAWTLAEEDLFARYGARFTIDHKRDLLGSSPQVSAVKLARMLARPEADGAALHEELHALVMARLDGAVPVMPGLVELLAALRAGGVPVGLASNSRRVFVERALAGAGLDDAFDVVIVGDEVPRPKPAPDVFLAVARALGALPAGCVALEDSPTGVRAARAAGMRVVGVPSVPGLVLDADVVADSLEERSVWAALGLARAGGP
jgi:HAD superfamily hydrolase (TIGR01509 family)